jgi:hypothetical protein
VTRGRLVAFAVAVASLAPALPVRAQDSGRLELSAGGGWTGGFTLGAANATESSAAGTPVTLFGTTTTLAPVLRLDGRVGWRLTRALTAEAEGSLGRPELRIAIANDIEGGAATTVVERVEQFTIGGALRWRLAHAPRRLLPFVAGGAGYLRELHENATLVQTGRYYAFGGGVVAVISARPASVLKATGIRIDARAIVRVKGVAFDESAHVSPVVGASFFVRF